MNFQKSLKLAGDRFTVTYSLFCSYEDAKIQTGEIAVENTIKYLRDLLSEGDIKNCLTGNVLSVSEIDPTHNRKIITYPVATTANELVNVLNVTMENIPEMLNACGKDLVFLKGGSLFRGGTDLADNNRKFCELVERV
jgi:hypothetical protein